MYTDFSESVRQCEIKLKNFISSSAVEVVPNAPITEHAVNGILSLNPNDSVTVIDPSKEYETTDDESSASDTEIFATPLPPPKQQNAKVNRFKAQQIKNVFFCEFCDKAFVSQEECLGHQLSSHDQQNPHICTFCTFHCASRNTIIAHIKECHDPKPFLCTQCHKKFGRRSDLRKHSVVHTGIRKLLMHSMLISLSTDNNSQPFLIQDRLVARSATRTSLATPILLNTCVSMIRINSINVCKGTINHTWPVHHATVPTPKIWSFRWTHSMTKILMWAKTITWSCSHYAEALDSVMLNPLQHLYSKTITCHQCQ